MVLMYGHRKIHGYVSDVEGDRWSAVLLVDGQELMADMDHDKFPLPPDVRGSGYLFTIHTTRRGHTYLFWPPARPLSRNRAKRIHREARDLARALGINDERPG